MDYEETKVFQSLHDREIPMTQEDLESELLLMRSDITDLNRRLEKARADLWEMQDIAGTEADVIKFGKMNISNIEEVIESKQNMIFLYEDYLRRMKGEIAG